MDRIPIAVESAEHRQSGSGPFVHLVLNDGTEASIYLEDGSPRNLLHDLLDTWIAADNTITPIEP